MAAGGQGGAGTSGGGAGGSINANPGGGAAGVDAADDRAGPGYEKGAQERTAPSQKSTQQTQPGAQQPQQAPAQQRKTESPQQGGAKQDAQTGDSKGAAQGKGMASSNVSLTTEQKTTIRNTVITSGPKATNVNFGIKVGVVVPRTVKVAPVPVTLVEIQPAWRGYMYFVYEDEIIIVEPRTLKIIAVLQV